MDYIVHGILQARILEWVAFPFARGSSWLRDQTQVSHIAGRFFCQLSHKRSPRVLQRVSYPFSSGSSRPKNRTGVSCIAGIFFTNWAIREFLINICQQFINHVSFGETFWQGFFKWTFPTVRCISFGWEGSTQVSAGCSSVQSLSHVWLFVTPWTTACQASLSITNSWSLPKLMSIESVMSSNHLIFCCPLLLLLSVFPSIRVFSNESALHIRWPKYWSYSFNISPSNEHSGLVGPPCSPRDSQKYSPEGCKWDFEFLGCFLLNMIMDVGGGFVCFFPSSGLISLRVIIPTYFYSLICIIHLATHWLYQLQVPEITLKYF